MGSLQLLVLACRSYQPTNQQCHPIPSSLCLCLLRRSSPCPAPPPPPHVQYHQLIAHPGSLPTAPSVPTVRSVPGRREGPVSGRRRPGELASAPAAWSAAERSA